MVDFQRINQNSRFKVIRQNSLYDLSTYQDNNRSVLLQERPGWNKSSDGRLLTVAEWLGETWHLPVIEDNLRLPPITTNERLAVLGEPEAGDTFITVKQVLFHTNRAASGIPDYVGHRFTCLLVSTEINSETKYGLFWSTHDNIDYIEEVTEQPPAPSPQQPATPVEIEIEVFAGQTAVVNLGARERDGQQPLPAEDNTIVTPLPLPAGHDAYPVDVHIGETVVLEIGEQREQPTRPINLSKKWKIPECTCTYTNKSGNLVKFYNDASVDPRCSEGLFKDICEAINQAEHFIFIAGWSFHPLLELQPNESDAGNNPIGLRLLEWCNRDPKRIVAIHTWDHTNIAVKDDYNDYGENIFTRILRADRNDMWGRRFFWRASSHYTKAMSHHQKFIVCDCPSPNRNNRRALQVFIGGIDLTQGRMDWPAHQHVNLSNEGDKETKMAIEFMRRQRKYYLSDIQNNYYYNTINLIDIIDRSNFYSIEWYNPELGNMIGFPKMPWHDIHSRIIGPAAWDVLREFVGRWRLDPCYTPFSAKCHDAKPQYVSPVDDKYLDVLWSGSFEKEEEGYESSRATDPTWTVQIHRSIVRDHWGGDDTNLFWTLSADNEKSIQEAYINAIRMAERFIYIETQFFIGSGNKWFSESNRRPTVTNDIPYEVVNKIIEKYRNDSEFHIYIIVPMFPEGNPSDASNQGVRDFQWRTFEYMIRELRQNDVDWRRYLTIGFLANWDSHGQINTQGNRENNVQN